MLWKAIAIDHDAFGRDHPVVAYDYTLIGDVLAGERGVQEAQSYYILALIIFIRVSVRTIRERCRPSDKLTRIAGPLRIWEPSWRLAEFYCAAFAASELL